jgi:hypothetical protein
MKKLSLEMLRLTSDEVLGRSQMKKITGGYGGTGNKYKCCDSGGCSACVTCNTPCSCDLGTLTEC